MSLASNFRSMDERLSDHWKFPLVFDALTSYLNPCDCSQIYSRRQDRG